jgi:hypothetical protein
VRFRWPFFSLIFDWFFVEDDEKLRDSCKSLISRYEEALTRFKEKVEESERLESMFDMTLVELTCKAESAHEKIAALEDKLKAQPAGPDDVSDGHAQKQIERRKAL